MRKTKISILANGFVKWRGGIDFISYVLIGLKATGNVEVEVVYLQEVSFSRFLQWAKAFLLGKPNPFDIERNELKAFSRKNNVPISNVQNEKALVKELQSNNINAVLPCFSVYPRLAKTGKAVGYIYDLQHKYLPQLFSEEDIQRRDNDFKEQLSNYPSIIVNANAVKNDLELFFPEFSGKTKIIVLPFIPFFHNLADNKELLITNSSFKNLENLLSNSPFFLVSNQFWAHKNHMLVLKAVLQLNAKGSKKFSVVCTGKMEDYRSANHSQQLKDFVKDNQLSEVVTFTGFVADEEHNWLMNNCVAVIQPSFFEGGPGGGCTYQALYLGKQVLLSNIPVNNEIQSNLVHFFNPTNEFELSQLMESVLNNIQTDSGAYNRKLHNISDYAKIGQVIMDSLA